MSKGKHVNQNNARPGDYAGVIAGINKDGVCPFCPEHLAKYHKNPIDEFNFWLVTDNMYPYKPTSKHKLLIHRTHIESIDQISPEAWSELMVIVKKTTTSEKITGGSFLMRFGDTHFTGASVTHLHCHIIQSNPDSSDYDEKTGLLTRIG
jgi:diadenosine tetraphosphate (Ap4A) HIT family hydrolase